MFEEVGTFPEAKMSASSPDSQHSSPRLLTKDGLFACKEVSCRVVGHDEYELDTKLELLAINDYPRL